MTAPRARQHASGQLNSAPHAYRLTHAEPWTVKWVAGSVGIRKYLRRTHPSHWTTVPSKWICRSIKPITPHLISRQNGRAPDLVKIQGAMLLKWIAV